ncbi:MAG TPA: sigma-70 family RNA polymerase sigma factor [Isosphaeraceae bacterium]|nr:sigma-70 family RNA polymerase sigma factor [Isosphaeraceae bacterium]
MNEVTSILSAIEKGDARAAGELLPLVYDELRRLAAYRLSREAPGQTLGATALVHEAYLRLVGAQDPGWNSRGHFFAAAAEAMRRILVENARRKRSERHGGGRQRLELHEADWLTDPIDDELLDLDEALTKLGAVDPQAAELVKLRVFAGMTVDEVAQHLHIAPRTVKRTWAYARAWLGRALGHSAEPNA